MNHKSRVMCNFECELWQHVADRVDAMRTANAAFAPLHAANNNTDRGHRGETESCVILTLLGVYAGIGVGVLAC
jgi:hypothetical protein